jgi:hypothetical protein
MQSQPQFKQASQESEVVRRARKALLVAYSQEEVALMLPHQALRAWEQMTLA